MNPSTFGITVNTPYRDVQLPALETTASRERFLSQQEIMKGELTALCHIALRVRSWWAAYEADVCCMDCEAHARITDSMKDMALFARSIVRVASLDVPVDEIRNYAWRPGKQTITFIGGRA